jgi:hypothetical protein
MHPLSLQSLQPLTGKILPATLDPLARASGFLRRRSQKINPANFLLTACLFALQSQCSLSAFAQLWALLHQQCLSKQAVQKRFCSAAVRFLQSVLENVLASLVLASPIPCGSAVRGAFKRIILQDSTCLSLPAKLAALFPGAANQFGHPQAGLKIQATLDLLKNQFLAFQVTPFVVNDQKASGAILQTLQGGDLIVRDLGYHVLEVLKQIDQKGAYFLSRFRYGISLLCPQSGLKLQLLEKLKQSGPLWQTQVLLGLEQLPARLIAVRLPEAVANDRRRKARANRDRRLNHNREYFQLLGWNIFITNVPESMLSATSLVELYALRWRIEIVFKAWKSHFRLGQLTEVSAEQLAVVILAKLIWICWFSVHWTVLVSQGLKVSLLKLAQWWSKFAMALCLSPQKISSGLRLDYLTYYCQYDKRKDRPNFLEKCARLS